MTKIWLVWAGRLHDLLHSRLARSIAPRIDFAPGWVRALYTVLIFSFFWTREPARGGRQCWQTVRPRCAPSCTPGPGRRQRRCLVAMCFGRPFLGRVVPGLGIRITSPFSHRSGSFKFPAKLNARVVPDCRRGRAEVRARSARKGIIWLVLSRKKDGLFNGLQEMAINAESAFRFCGYYAQ